MFRVQNRTLKRLLGAYLHLKNFSFIFLFLYIISIFYNKIIYYILYYYILYVCVRVRSLKPGEGANDLVEVQHLELWKFNIWEETFAI